VFSQMMDRLDWSTLESGYARLCESACNNDPSEGMIGVEN